MDLGQVAIVEIVSLLVKATAKTEVVKDIAEMSHSTFQKTSTHGKIKSGAP